MFMNKSFHRTQPPTWTPACAGPATRARDPSGKRFFAAASVADPSRIVYQADRRCNTHVRTLTTLKPPFSKMLAATVTVGRGCFGQPGWWVKPRVRWPTFSAAMTKQTRPGPRLGKGALVYLTEMGSMYPQSSSGRTSMTLPCTAAIR